jgi:chemotaxis protein MotB
VARPRRENRLQSEIWPGFVDALSTLVMVFIFLLSVFVVAQFFLSQLIAGRDERLRAMEQELVQSQGDVEEQRFRLDDLRRTLARLSADLGLVTAERDTAESQLADTRSERDEVVARLDRLHGQNLALEQALGEARGDAEAAARAREQVLAELRAAEDRVRADRATIEAQLDDLVRLRQDVAALTELRDRLEAEVAGVVAAREDLLQELGVVRNENLALTDRLATAEQRTMLMQEELDRELAQARDALEEVEILTANLVATRDALGRLETLLAEREDVIAAQDLRLEDLDVRLTAALAAQVDELLQFRSEFFGRLRQALGQREDVRIEGDRFVFQSEVLFAPGEATLGATARDQLASLARTLRVIAADIPSDLPWILQIDGHTDRTPIATGRFPSNWELSAARAISVAQFLTSQGIPPERLAAAGFAEFQPLDPGEGEEAFRRNRRIELKLTTR